MSVVRIKIGVAAAGVDRTVTDPDVRETVRIISADGNIAGRVVIQFMDAVMPLQA